MKLVGAVLVAVILPLLLSEFTDWCPTFAKHLVRRAVRRLPDTSRARWEEEWLGDLAAFEGRRLSILVRGLWIYFRAPSWGRTLRGLPPVSHALLNRIRLLIQRPKEEQHRPVSALWTPTGAGKSEALAQHLLHSRKMTVTVEERDGGRNVVIIDTDDGEEHRFEATDRELSTFWEQVKGPVGEQIELASSSLLTPRGWLSVLEGLRCWRPFRTSWSRQKPW